MPDNHHTSLSVTAKMIEEGLEKVDSKLKDNTNYKIIKILKESHGSETKEKIFKIIKDIKTVNKEMFTALSLTLQISYESWVV